MAARARWLTAIVLLLVLTALVPSAGAQGALTVRTHTHSVAFAEGITFRLEADAPSEVQELDLMFQLDGEIAVNRVIVSEPSGRSLSASWTWDLIPGELPPGQGVDYWWRAVLADGTVAQTDKAHLKYDDDRFSWSQAESGPITIYWYGGDSAGARNLLETADDALDRLQETVGVTLEQDVRIYLYGSKSDMSLAIASRSASYDESTITLGMAMGGDTLLLLRNANGVKGTTAHEMSHLVVGQAARSPYQGLPVWLDEGLAMYAEGSLGDNNADPLSRAIRNNTLLPLSALTSYTGDAGEVDLWYGECYSVVDFLLRKYERDRMTQFLRAFKDGQGPTQALGDVYGLTLDELEAQWREDIGAAPKPTPAPYVPETRPQTSSGASTSFQCGAPAALLVVVGLVLRRVLSAL